MIYSMYIYVNNDLYELLLICNICCDYSEEVKGKLIK